MLWRLALGLATTRSPEHRWRRIGVPLASIAFMFTLVAATSLLYMDRRQEARLWNRTGLIAREPSPTDILMKLGFDYYRGQQITIIWIEPASSQQPVLPAGLNRLPDPGTFAVSPALAELIVHEPELAKRYRIWTVLDRAGVKSAGELFAYARPAPGRSIARDPSTLRIEAFATPGATVSWDFTTNLGDVYLVSGLFISLVLPGFLILAAGLATASTVRDHRFIVLAAIGVPQQTLIKLSVIESLVLALPGLIIAAAAWVVVSARLRTIPLVDQQVFAGDLEVGVLDAVLLLSLGLLCTCALGFLVARWSLRSGASRPRPSLPRAVVSRLRVLPPLISLALFGASVIMIPSDLGATLFLSAVASSIATIPFVYAGLVRAVGSELAKVRYVSVMLAGRLLSWDPVRLTRPYASLGTIIMIAMVSMAFGKILSSYENPELHVADASAVLVSWVDPRPEDVSRFQAALGSGTVIPLKPGDDGMAMGASCQDIAEALNRTDCLPHQPYTLPESLQQELQKLVPNSSPYSLESPDTLPVSGHALVLARESLPALHERVSTAAWQTLPAPHVFSWELFIKRIDNRNAWLIGGILAALALLGLGSVIALVDRLIANRVQRTVLLRIGLATSRLRILEAWLFAVPYVTVSLASLAAGSLLAWLILDTWKKVSPPWGQFGVLFALDLGAGLIGVLAVMALGVSTITDRPAIRR